MMAVCWKDKRDVCMLSTCHQCAMRDSGKKDQQGNTIENPDVVLEYNNVMGAVDKVDQMLEPYAMQRKGVKWYIKLFEHLLDVSVFNSFVLYKQCNVNSKLAFLDYKLLLVEKMVTKYHFGGTASARGPSVDCPLRLTARHFPSHIAASFDVCSILVILTYKTASCGTQNQLLCENQYTPQLQMSHCYCSGTKCCCGAYERHSVSC